MYIQEEEEAEIDLHAAHADEDRVRGSHIRRTGGGREGGRGEGEPAGKGGGGGKSPFMMGFKIGSRMEAVSPPFFLLF
jgi:hypothetical protein